MKKQADCPPFTKGKLPKSARKWMQNHPAFLTNSVGKEDPALRDIQQQLDRLTIRLKLDNDQAQTFRDWHYLADPNHSIAGLPISNDLFLILIQADIHTISNLNKCLQTRDLPPCLSDKNGRKNQLNLLRQAVQTQRQ